MITLYGAGPVDDSGRVPAWTWPQPITEFGERIRFAANDKPTLLKIREQMLQRIEDLRTQIAGVDAMKEELAALEKALEVLCGTVGK